MPEFYPRHTLKNLDEFTRGYLDCAEWLLPEPGLDDQSRVTARDKVRGWTRAAISTAMADCAAFQSANSGDLAAFCELAKVSVGSAGHDFWLTRNGHGAGYWDRDAGDTGDRLTLAAAQCGPCDVDPYRGWLYLTPWSQPQPQTP